MFNLVEFFDQESNSVSSRYSLEALCTFSSDYRPDLILRRLTVWRVLRREPSFKVSLVLLQALPLLLLSFGNWRLLVSVRRS